MLVNGDPMKGFMVYCDKLHIMLDILNANQFKELFEMALRFIETVELPEITDTNLLVSWNYLSDWIKLSYNHVMAESILGKWGAVKRLDPDWKDKKNVKLADWYGLQDDFNPDFIENKSERLRAIAIHQNLPHFRSLKEQFKTGNKVNPSKPKSTKVNPSEQINISNTDTDTNTDTDKKNQIPILIENNAPTRQATQGKEEDSIDITDDLLQDLLKIDKKNLPF